MRERKYRMKARIMCGTRLVGYQLIAPSCEVVRASLEEAAQLAQAGMINNVRLGSDGKLRSDGIKIGNLPVININL